MAVRIPKHKTLLCIIFDQVLSNHPGLCRLATMDSSMIPKTPNRWQVYFVLPCIFLLFRHALFQNLKISTEDVRRNSKEDICRVLKCKVLSYLNGNINCLKPKRRPKWPPFYRRHFKCIFLNKIYCLVVEITLNFVSKSAIDNTALVQIMTWRRMLPASMSCVSKFV